MGNTRVGMKGVHREETGAFVITLPTFSDDGDVDLVLSEDEAVRLCQFLQEGFFDPRLRTEHPHYPQLTVTDANIAEGAVAALLVQTVEIGSVAVSFNPALADKLKHEIDRCVASNEMRSKPKN